MKKSGACTDTHDLETVLTADEDSTPVAPDRSGFDHWQKVASVGFGDVLDRREPFGLESPRGQHLPQRLLLPIHPPIGPDDAATRANRRARTIGA